MRPFVLVAFIAVLIFPDPPGLCQNAATHERSLRLTDAKRVAATAMDRLRYKNLAGVVAVVDSKGSLVCLERADEAPPAGVNIAIDRARLASRFKTSARSLAEKNELRCAAVTSRSDPAHVRGGAPIVADGRIVGAVGVSGGATAVQDQEIAAESARALAAGGTQKAVAGLPVTYFDRETVAAAFAKAATLFDGTGRNYKVMTGNRDKPGIAEIHILDTDVFYVTEGTATFVTGGSVPDAKSIAANELRGSSIRGGEVRMLAKGDVIIIPAGIPHWFRDVTPPFSYFVVKVR